MNAIHVAHECYSLLPEEYHNLLELKPFSIHSFIMRLEVPKKRLCIGSTGHFLTGSK